MSDILDKFIAEGIDGSMSILSKLNGILPRNFFPQQSTKLGLISTLMSHNNNFHHVLDVLWKPTYLSPFSYLNPLSLDWDNCICKLFTRSSFVLLYSIAHTTNFTFFSLTNTVQKFKHVISYEKSSPKYLFIM